MTSDCVLCHHPTTETTTLPLIINAFKTLLNELEKQTISSENARRQELNDLNVKLSEADEKFLKIEDEKNIAEKRSDLYKKRFLDAQNAIKELHEKNLQLSSQKSRKKNCSENFPFSHDKRDISPKTKKIILAPDTCFVEAEIHDVTYVSSDDEDFKQDSKKNCKSPKIEKIPTPSKSVAESFFAKPIKSPKRNAKNIKKKFLTPVHVPDMDETRMELEVEERMETSMDNSLTHVEAMTDSQILEVCKEPYSIPPSPILSAGKPKRFGSSAFHVSKQGLPKLSGSLEAAEKEEKGPSFLSANQKYSKSPSLTRSNVSNKKKIVYDADETTIDSEGWNFDNPVVDSLPLHRLRQESPTKQNYVNTSLDELFDKTDGELETTSILNNTTHEDVASKDETNSSDDEIDALLLEGLGEENLAHPSQNISSRIETRQKNVLNNSSKNSSVSGIARPILEDSFDVLPSKVKEKKNFKYQEVVRKRDEREKLDAKACAQCEAYYSDLPEDERREVMRKVCRHKHVDAPPSTPEHFWEIGIPNTAECRKRGYIVDETNLPTKSRQSNHDAPRLRRKKPLESYFNTKKR